MKLIADGLCVTCWLKSMDEAEGVTYRYFITEGNEPEQEVTKAQWVNAERRAGFHNTLGHNDEPGTGGFSTTAAGGLKGRIERIKPEQGQKSVKGESDE